MLKALIISLLIDPDPSVEVKAGLYVCLSDPIDMINQIIQTYSINWFG